MTGNWIIKHMGKNQLRHGHNKRWHKANKDNRGSTEEYKEVAMCVPSLSCSAWRWLKLVYKQVAISTPRWQCYSAWPEQLTKCIFRVDMWKSPICCAIYERLYIPPEFILPLSRCSPPTPLVTKAFSTTSLKTAPVILVMSFSSASNSGGLV